MSTLLQIDASARDGRSGETPYGSHTRRLTHRFVERWAARRPGDLIARRDVGLHPPSPVSGAWIHAAFTPPAAREAWMAETLAESDALVAELLAADVLVFGAPMYNFGLPAQLKAYVDNIVRVGVTFGFDRAREGEPYWPLLTGRGKTAVILTSRGDFGYDPGQRLEANELVVPGLSVPLGYLGVTDVRTIAVEYDEFGGDRLADSLRQAEAAVDALVDRMLREREATPAVMNA